MLKKVGLLIFLLLTTFYMWGQHTFTVNAPRVVERDEVFSIVFTANGEIKDFVSPTFSGLEVLVGPSPSARSSSSTINGKRTESFERSYSFIVKPLESGKAQVSGASATIDDKIYSTQKFEIDVLKGESTSRAAKPKNPTTEITADDLFLRLTLDKENVVEGEPIIATLKLYTKVPIAGFENVRFPVFNGFWSQEIDTPQNINFERENVDGAIYNSAILRKYVLLPQQTGEMEIPSAEMICQIQVKAVRLTQQRSIFDDFFDDGYQIIKKRLISKERIINVKPLPSGAPSSFGSGVGKFNMEVSVSNDQLKAHEASSIVIQVTGSGNLNLIEAPKIELPADFEKYDVKSDNNFTNGVDGISGSKTFEFPFIPRSEGRFVIPPIKYSYYDISSDRYVTLKNDSIVLNIARGENITNSGLVQGIGKQAVVNLGEDIRYIVSKRHNLRGKFDYFIGSLWFFLSISIIILVFIALWYYLKSMIKFRGDIKRVRNKKANKIAKSRLKQAYTYMNDNIQSAFFEELHKALLGYIGDKLSIQFADMNKDRIKEILEQSGISSEDANNFIALLDDCEMARYSQSFGATQMTHLYEKAIDIISNLEGSL